MKEQFVTYDIAVKLKELGFSQPCIAGFNSYKALKHNISSTNANLDDYDYTYRYDSKLLAPLWQQVIDWFRTEYDLLIYVSSFNKDKHCHSICGYYNEQFTSISDFFETYGEALESAILSTIDLIKSRKE